MNSRAASKRGSAAASWTASSSRCAALPVGAASATSGGTPPRLLDQQRQDPRHGGGLAGARAAGHDREAPPHRGLRRRALAVVRPAARTAGPGRRRARRRARVRRPEREQILRHAALLAPVAVQVQRRADEPQRPVREPVLTDRDERARRQAREPVLAATATAARTGRSPRPRCPRSPSRRSARRSTNTCPCRGARTASAAASAIASSRLARQRRQAHGHVDVGGGQQPDGVERLQQPVRAHGAAAVERVQLRHGHTAVLQQPVQLEHERGRRAPGEDAARLPVDHRRVRADHAADEQVQHAAQVRRRVVAREPPAQVAVQRDGVEQRLQPVVGAFHLLGQRRRPVVPGRERLAGRGEPVRLVVDDVERAVQPQREVDAAGQVAAHRRAQVRVAQPVRVARERIARREVAAQDVADRARRHGADRRVTARQRQLEVQLVQPVRARHVAQPHVVRPAARAASPSPPAARRWPPHGPPAPRAGAPSPDPRAPPARRPGPAPRSPPPRRSCARTCRTRCRRAFAEQQRLLGQLTGCDPRSGSAAPPARPRPSAPPARWPRATRASRP